MIMSYFQYNNLCQLVELRQCSLELYGTIQIFFIFTCADELNVKRIKAGDMHCLFEKEGLLL